MEKKKSNLKNQINAANLKNDAEYTDKELKDFLLSHKDFKSFSDLDKKIILELFINKIEVFPQETKIHLNLIDLDGLHKSGRGETERTLYPKDFIYQALLN